MDNNIDGQNIETVHEHGLITETIGAKPVKPRPRKNIRRAYDRLAEVYHLMFSDWDGLIGRQATGLKEIIERELGTSQTLRILDPTCGIGTQVLGLASMGYSVTGCDISPDAVERARREVSARGLHIPLYVADVRNLTSVQEIEFDVVVSLGNSLCAFRSFEELVVALTQMRGKLRAGGLLIAGVRDYDRAIALRTGPLLVDRPLLCFDMGKRRIVIQVWEWVDGTRYIAHVYIDCEDGVHHRHSVPCRVIGREELTDALRVAGFTNVRWLSSEGQTSNAQSVYESGFDQLTVLAIRP